MEGWERMASGNSEVSSGWRCKLQSHRVANEAELIEVRVDTVVVVVGGGVDWQKCTISGAADKAS